MQSCGQETETYWKSENVTKIDNTPFRGITSAYMDMIAEMQIHLSKNNDSLIFNYPNEKTIKISELKSLTNCRIPSTGQLLDSVYDVRVENDKLKIKFHYIGTGDEEKRFVLNLIKIDKKEFLEETERLQKEKTKLKNIIKPINATTLDLSILKPTYLNTEIDLNKLNPIALAEDLCDVKHFFNSTALKNESFTIKDKGSFQYNYYNIQNSNKIASEVANIGNIKFNSLAFITNEADNKNNAIIFTQNELQTKSIQTLYDLITSKMKSAKINEIGLPEDVVSISRVFGIVWTTEKQKIKLLIETPEEILYQKADANFSLPYTEDVHSEKDILRIFKHYLSLTEKAKIRIVIASTEFDELLNADGFSGNRPTILGEDEIR